MLYVIATALVLCILFPHHSMKFILLTLVVSLFVRKPSTNVFGFFRRLFGVTSNERKRQRDDEDTDEQQSKRQRGDEKLCKAGHKGANLAPDCTYDFIGATEIPEGKGWCVNGNCYSEETLDNYLKSYRQKDDPMNGSDWTKEIQPYLDARHNGQFPTEIKHTEPRHDMDYWFGTGGGVLREQDLGPRPLRLGDLGDLEQPIYEEIRFITEWLNDTYRFVSYLTRLDTGRYIDRRDAFYNKVYEAMANLNFFALQNNLSNLADYIQQWMMTPINMDNSMIPNSLERIDNRLAYQFNQLLTIVRSSSYLNNDVSRRTFANAMYAFKEAASIVDFPGTVEELATYWGYADRG